mmetsp:Transcript_19683/g.29208  ORF Transcript_19683/g.29208 Transcript_19683/m.29208 type:complete len:282 (+) Transcript_19683:111-956(+)
MKKSSFCFLFLCFLSSHYGRAFVPHYGVKPIHHKTKALHAEKSNKTKGIYVRPSAAIERGSGFFIPGLEGPRVRLLFGLSILVLTTLNHFIGSNTTGSPTEILAIGYAILLLLQAAIEFGKEEKGFIVSLKKATDDDPQKVNELDLVQRWSPLCDISNKIRERTQWSAATFFALTPANRIMLLDNSRIIFCLGQPLDLKPDQERDGCSAALKTLAKSKSGQVSLPSSHPAAKLVAAEESRCVVLQIISNDQCLLMSSKQLLQAFTEQDLKWLGQFAAFLNA